MINNKQVSIFEGQKIRRIWDDKKEKWYFSVVDIIKANEKTIGEHTRRLVTAGLISKEYRGKFVEHTLSSYAKVFVDFLKKFQNIQ